MSARAASHGFSSGMALVRAPPGITRGWKLRPLCGCPASGRMRFELWTNCRRGFDISIPRLWSNEAAIVKQAGLDTAETSAAAATVGIECDQTDWLRYWRRRKGDFCLATWNPSPGSKDRAPGLSRMAIPDSSAAVRSPSKRNRGVMGCTSERRLIYPLHWVEKTIRRFIDDWPGPSPLIALHHVLRTLKCC